MELIPIIFKILACCVILFLVVLTISFLFSKSPKQEEINYKKIIEDRKLAYSMQRDQLNNSLNFDNSLSSQHSFSEKVNNDIKPIRKQTVAKEYADHKMPKLSPDESSINKPFKSKSRYTVLNETMTIEPVRKEGNKEVQIFYPINFQRSA
jgi:hypothetical protein